MPGQARCKCRAFSAPTTRAEPGRRSILGCRFENRTYGTVRCTTYADRAAASLLQCRGPEVSPLKKSLFHLTGSVVAIAVAVACSEPRSAELSIELAGPIFADPVIAFFRPTPDGSVTCVGGWEIHAMVRIREIGGVDVALREIAYRFVDADTGDELDSEVRDYTRPHSFYWSNDPTAIPAHGEATFDLGALSFFGDRGARRPPSSGPVMLSGTVTVQECDGRRREVPFAFTAQAIVRTSARPLC